MWISSLATFIFLTVVSARHAFLSSDSPVNSKYMAKFNDPFFGDFSFSVQNGLVKVDILIGLPIQDEIYEYFISSGPLSISSPEECKNAQFTPDSGKFDNMSWDLYPIGNLQGKYGDMSGYTHQDTYFTPFLSLNPKSEAFIGHSSVVVKSRDGRSVACAKIVEVQTYSSNQDGEIQTREILKDAGVANQRRNVQMDSEMRNQTDSEMRNQTDSGSGSYYPFTLSANSTMEDFLANNRYYVDEIKHDHGSVVLDINAKGQSPHTFWIGCSDSRSGESSLATLPGEIFTHRNIANIVSMNDTYIHGAIGFATDTLKVSKIIVCGHTDCGGVKAALFDTSLGPILDEWITPIKRLRERNEHLLNQVYRDEARSKALSELNVLESVDVLKKHPSVAAAIANGSLEVWGMVYDVASGRLYEVKIFE